MYLILPVLKVNYVFEFSPILKVRHVPIKVLFKVSTFYNNTT